MHNHFQSITISFHVLCIFNLCYINTTCTEKLDMLVYSSIYIICIIIVNIIELDVLKINVIILPYTIFNYNYKKKENRFESSTQKGFNNRIERLNDWLTKKNRIKHCNDIEETFISRTQLIVFV